jgi:Na+(H+)/acetate symporter ActP
VNQTYGIVGVTAVILATVLVGALGLRISRTTSDFYVASRTVAPRLNACAVSGEYLSAASFLGVAAARSRCSGAGSGVRRAPGGSPNMPRD